MQNYLKTKLKANLICQFYPTAACSLALLTEVTELLISELSLLVMMMTTLTIVANLYSVLAIDRNNNKQTL